MAGAPPSSSNRQDRSDAWRYWGERHAALFIVCAVAAAIYLSLWRASFLSWDDDKNISANPYYLYLKWWQLWKEPYFGLYVPVVSSIWAALFKLGNGAAWVFRLFNAALHVLNIVLVWRLLSEWFKRSGLDRSSAQSDLAVLIGVTVFALHPLQTATVSWISGGRDLSAASLGLAAVLLYFREGRRNYVVATLLFALGLLCKPGIAGIPLAVMGYVAILERPRLAQTVRDMSLWCVLVIAAGVVTSAIQSEMTRVSVPLYQRPLVVLDAIGFYLLKLVWPFSLNTDYGRTPSRLWEQPQLAIPTLAAAVVVGLVLLWAVRRQRPYAWSALWLLLILPVLGLTTFSFQRISTVADHYSYLPMVAVAGFTAVVASQHLRNRKSAWGVWAVLLFAGALASWNRVRVWRDDRAFYGDILQKNPQSFLALTNLTQTTCIAGDTQAGLQLIDRALDINPNDASALANKAYCLFHAQRFDDVLGMQTRLSDPDVQFSLEHNDASASSLANTIAGASLYRDDPGRAWMFLCQAVAITPHDFSVRQNAEDVAQTFAQMGRRVRCPGRLSWSEFASLLSNP